MQNADNTDGGQVFTTTDAGTIEAVQYCLVTASSPTGNVQVDLYANSGGEPTGASLGQATITASSIGSLGLYAFNFSSPIPVSAGTSYVLTVNRSTYAVGSVRACGGSSGPNDGVYSNDNGSTWSGIGSQFATQIDVITSDTPTTTPATTTVQYVDSPTDDLFHGYILFLAGFVIIIWLMRGRKTH